MAGLTQAMTTSFKVELLKGLHDFSFGADAMYIALFKANASITGTYGAATTNYSNMTGNTDETTGANYTAGGNLLVNVTPIATGTTAFCDFGDTTWSTATVTSRGALIYNTTNADSAVAVLDFGADKTSTAGDFSIIFPTADSANAIIRIA